MGKLKVTNIGKNIPLFLKRLKKLKPVFVRTIEEDVRNFNSYELVYICLTNLNWLTNNKVFDYSKKELKDIIKALPKKNTKQFNELVTKISDILDKDFDNKRIIEKQKQIDTKISNQQLNDDNFDSSEIILTSKQKDRIEDIFEKKFEELQYIDDENFEEVLSESITEVTGKSITDIFLSDFEELSERCKAFTNLVHNNSDENKVSLSEDEINIIVDTVGLQTANYSTIQPDTLSNIVADAIFEVTGNNVTDISTEDYTEIYTQCEDLYLTEMNVQESYMEEYM